MAYVTNLTHFQDKNGNIPENLPQESRNLASFLVLVIDEVTRHYPKTDRGIETGIKCFETDCDGNIIGAIDMHNEPIKWYCLDCGNTGTVSNWQNSKWDNTKS